MKFIKFEQAAQFIPGQTVGADGAIVDNPIPFYQDPNGFVVVRLELTKEELSQIKGAGGQVFMIMGPGVFKPVGFTMQVKDPFIADPKPPAGKILGMDGKPLS
jgi:hypothetical protein